MGKSDSLARTTAFTWPRLLTLAVVAAIVAAGLWPHVERLRRPSIFGDDVPRIVVLQHDSLRQALLRPFNEHVAPFFDSVTWLAWAAVGGRLTRTPAAFTVAAFVPFALSLIALGVLAGRDLRSWPAAAIVVAVFAIAPIHVVETVWWYSGSNHMWAVLWTIVALLGAGRGGVAGNLAAGLGTALAPSCSMMGILTAPAVMVYLVARRGRWRQAWPGLAATAAGLVVYVVVAMSVGLVGAVRVGVERNADFFGGLLCVGRAPSTVLIPAMVGIRDLDLTTPAPRALAITGVLLAVTLAWSLWSRDRALILVAVFFIFGAYGLIYPFRTRYGAEHLFRSARYHLYPQLGLSLLLGAAARPWLGGRRGGWIALAAVGALLAIHLPRMTAEARIYDFANQPRTLAAIERVEAICRAEGITRRQAIDVLEPIRTRWMPNGLIGAPPLSLLGAGAPTSRVADADVRARLLAGLGAEDRQGLFGGMDVGRYSRPPAAIAGSEAPIVEGRLIGSSGMRRGGSPGEFVAEGWPSSALEFALDAPRDLVATARYLALHVRDPEAGVEVWWADDDRLWSEGRSIHFGIDPAHPDRNWAVPLDRLPHWDGRRVRFLRVTFRFPGPVFAGVPRLLR